MVESRLDGTSVLVTGAGGFIGSHLVGRLALEGARVTALVHYNSRNDPGLLSGLPSDLLAEIQVVAGDVRDECQMENLVKGKELIFHLAALVGIPYSYNAPESYVQTNILGTLNILKSARRCGVGRVIHTSTSETYGTARYVPIDEGHPLQAQSPYSASKIAADKLAESFHLSFGLPVVTIRPFNTFGPRQSLRAIVPTIVAQALRGDKIALGSLEPVRDLNYVDNTVDGFLLCATIPGIEGELFNIGRGEGLSVGQLLQQVGRTVGRPLEAIVDERRFRPDASEVMRLVCNPSKAATRLGYRAQVGLVEGLERTVEFIRQNVHLYADSRYIV